MPRVLRELVRRDDEFWCVCEFDVAGGGFVNAASHRCCFGWCCWTARAARACLIGFRRSLRKFLPCARLQESILVVHKLQRTNMVLIMGISDRGQARCLHLGASLMSAV
mmetsp:Transcript_3553/g.7746  ORF Transcript_3553/g.7746 Transcript_3553/m.7746 type:complete len:109 (-) Transcript_3553:1428-1754(-)